MAKNKGGDTPDGVKSTQKTPEQNDTVRRTKKAHQRHGGTKQATGSLFEELLEDRRQQATEARQQRELDAYYFSCEQATRAREHSWFVELKPGTTAYRFAVAVLEAFPLADLTQQEKETKVSRTAKAAQQAWAQMSESDILHDKAIGHGRRVATTALRWAYDQLTAGAEAEQVTA